MYTAVGNAGAVFFTLRVKVIVADWAGSPPSTAFRLILMPSYSSKMVIAACNLTMYLPGDGIVGLTLISSSSCVGPYVRVKEISAFKSSSASVTVRVTRGEPALAPGKMDAWVTGLTNTGGLSLISVTVTVTGADVDWLPKNAKSSAITLKLYSDVRSLSKMASKANSPLMLFKLNIVFSPSIL